MLCDSPDEEPLQEAIVELESLRIQSSELEPAPEPVLSSVEVSRRLPISANRRSHKTCQISQSDSKGREWKDRSAQRGHSMANQ